VAIDNMAYGSIENGITKELQPLIVQRLALVVALADALVQECLAIILDMVGIEAEYLVESRKKLLLLAEREPYAVDEIINPHIF